MAWFAADGDISGSMWGVIGAAVVGVPAIGVFVINWISKRSEIKSKDRVDAFNELKAVIDIERANRDAERVQTQGQINTMNAEINRLHKEEMECQKQNADMRVAIARGEEKQIQLSDIIQRLRAKLSDLPTGVTMPASITATFDGKIVNAAGGITPLLHWLPQHLQGKNVRDTLVPKRFLEEYDAGLAKAKDANYVIDPTMVHPVYAMSGEGKEVPVAINLAKWAEQPYITAEIRDRVPTGDSDLFRDENGMRPKIVEKIRQKLEKEEPKGDQP